MTTSLRLHIVYSHRSDVSGVAEIFGAVN